MLSSFKSKKWNVFLPIHLWAFSNGVSWCDASISFKNDLYSTYPLRKILCLLNWMRKKMRMNIMTTMTSLTACLCRRSNTSLGKIENKGQAHHMFSRFLNLRIYIFFHEIVFVLLNRLSRRKKGMGSNPLFIIPDFFLHFPNELCYPPIYLNWIFQILQFEISSLMNWIFFLVWTGFL